MLRVFLATRQFIYLHQFLIIRVIDIIFVMFMCSIVFIIVVRTSDSINKKDTYINK